MKKLFALVLALVMILSLCACGKKEEKTPDGEAIGGNIVNPVSEETRKSILETVGVDLEAPKGAKDVSYQSITADNIIAQMKFTQDGKAYNYRVMSATDYSDISGMYYDWKEVEPTNVGGIIAEASYIPGEQGIINWYDVVPGLLYSLSVDSGASLEVLKNMAEKLYAPTQGEVNGDFDSVFAGILSDIQKNCEIGTAGSSLKAAGFAGKLLDAFTTYKPNAADVQSAVSSYYISLGSKAKATFGEQMNAVASAAEQLLGENGEGLLSDCGYQAQYYPWDASVMSAYVNAIKLG
jgi:hypothetical protein